MLRRRYHRSAKAIALAVCLLAVGANQAAAAAKPTGIVVAGPARFEILTPRLIRLEYAADGRFENRPTMLAFNRQIDPPPYTVHSNNGTLVIRTARITLSYKMNSGPFTTGNLILTVAQGHGTTRATPQWESASYDADPKGIGPLGYFGEQDQADTGPPPTSGNLGGWARSLDQQSGPIELHPGLLSRDGWFFIDDTRNVVLTDGGARFAGRPAHVGAYQDGYLFGYGHDYAAGLADYRRLSGAAPLLPRKAFGVWFSRYYAYTEPDYHTLLAQFRANRVPLDVLMVDTDFKSPNAWDGWEWNSQLFPDPTRFTAWAHSEGLDLGFNIHPSISASDPRFTQANTIAGGGLEPFAVGPLIEGALAGDPTALAQLYYTFDWADPKQLAAYFWLQQPFDRAGVNFWWLDWCCDEARVDGLVPNGTLSGDAWINYQQSRQNATLGSRWLSLARMGASFEDWAGNEPGPWGEQRSTIQFTGDAQSSWAMLNFETVFDVDAGNVGLPYVSDDIGGFLGDHLSDQLYARWIQLGTFSSILRPHSNHGDRLPWDYPGQADTIASAFLRLRESLIPYTYTVARQAYDTGLPITRGTYLTWPNQNDAYLYNHEYMYGPELLVAPVGTAGDPATETVWFPPGTWVDIFTRQRFKGPSVHTLSVPLKQMPVFARAGSIVPLAPYMDYSSERPLSPLTLDVYAGHSGSFNLYEDAGTGFGYQHGQFARTPMRWNQRTRTLTIGPARGHFPGQLRRRAYVVRLIGANRTLTRRVRALSTSRRITIRLRSPGR
jgi:hypothetical protein